MSIRRTDGQKPINTPRSTTSSEPTAKNTVKPAATPEKAKGNRVSTDGFGPTVRPSELARAEQTLTPLVPQPRPGRVALNSPEGQTAIQATLATLDPQSAAPTGRALMSASATSQAFVPRNIERDDLGMTHVRMDRLHEGVKVFGEQVISHLDKDGKVTSLTGDKSVIPAGLGSQKPKLSPAQVEELVRKDFADKPDRQPSAERVIYKDPSGTYHSAYRVEISQIAGQAQPRRMNYLVDANTGKIYDKFNTIDGFVRQGSAKAGSTSTSTAPTQATGSVSPKEHIKDLGTLTSKLTLGQDVSIGKLKLSLDLTHSKPSDLTVTLTSPSGKSAVVFNGAGSTSTTGVKGDFDLSAFAGEHSKGDWTLTVKDGVRKGTGTLNTWGLTATAKTGTPQPPPPTGTPNDTTMYSGKVDLVTTKNADGTYSLRDNTRGKGVVTFDGQNKEKASGQTDFKDTNDVWGETSDPARSKAAVDAHYGAEMTYDFYKNVLGRDSIDGSGEQLKSYVHISKNYDNAYWDGNQMNYGDGDGSEFSPLTTLDIAGHEISHGFTERTAGLVYSGESGGLNEAMSDIMGVGVEWYASQKNPSVKFDWKIGEDAYTPGNGTNDALRYMDDPTKDGYSLDNYKNFKNNTEVHSSSGIANNAFYLLANGGTNRTSGLQVKDGIGMEKGLKVFGRALAHYMTPNTTFAQARQACISAATDLYGANSAEVQKVKDSWSAVGVN
ncbi:M4 family metallopeptidase [Vitiosangium sp. GDMCC 1.1324]|uniref:M4 family metallopeptidase n=1 Tax=Vitiosangium sp. (strain GDMCC 1.1324) TaxID=2138576 RepID=UPI000D353C91|nr:M4 family metallopeptidase [Vitiosangium sp. GDMCC 1.1324]PTL75581.1 peptidase M4 [Vitiosangium sp. GDMCC 1.1324]